MKKLISFLYLLIFTASCSLMPHSSKRQSKVKYKDVPYKARKAYNSPLKKRILILPFLDEKVRRSQKAKNLARRTIVSELYHSGHFVIVKNSDFPQDLTQFITKEKDYDLEKISNLAANLGVSAVIEGKIIEIRAKKIREKIGLFREVKAQVSSTIRIRVISTRNAKIILNDIREATIQSSTTRVGEFSYSDRYLEEDPILLKKSIHRAFIGTVNSIAKSIDKISWEGKIAMVNGERVFINAGRISGLQIGDILKVTEPGEEVFDPETGQFIGRTHGRMKGTVEVINYFGRDGAVAVIHSGSGFRENDQIEVY